MFKISSFQRTFALLFILAAMLAILTLYKKNIAPDNQIKLRQPAVNLTLSLPDNYAFRQDDPKWGARKLGKTEDNLSDYGCTVTSLAIAASNLLKTEISPDEMNTRLNKADGYTKSGLLTYGGMWEQPQKARYAQL